MDSTVITTLISTSGAVLVGLGGMWISTNQLGKRLDDVVARLVRIETKLDSHAERITRLEERTSPLVRG